MHHHMRDNPDQDANSLFLVRESTTSSGEFSLSFWQHDTGKIVHSRIRCEKGKYFLTDQVAFTSLCKLIEHYKVLLFLGEPVPPSNYVHYVADSAQEVMAEELKPFQLSQSPIRGDSLVSFGGEGIYGMLAKMGYNTFSLARVASAGAPGAPPTHEELYASLSTGLTREELYARCATYASIVASKEAYEETKMKKMSPEEKQAVLVNADEEMGKHRAEYDKLFVPWSSESWIGFLKDKHGELTPHFVSNPAQPNPWESEGIDTKSKYYLIKLMEVFEDTSASSPTKTVEEVCTKVVGMLGDDVAEFRCGPLKKRSRVFEKVLMLDGRFDWIRDYARNYIVIKKGHFTDMAMVPTLLARQKEVEMVRAKNRFDPAYNPKQTAGYRDYQIILKTKEGWLVEVQVIPEEMLELKESLSHEVYTEYRFIMEAAKRGGFGDFNQYDLLADLTTDLNHEDHRYDLVADRKAEPDSVGGGVGDYEYGEQQLKGAANVHDSTAEGSGNVRAAGSSSNLYADISPGHGLEGNQVYAAPRWIHRRRQNRRRMRVQHVPPSVATENAAVDPPSAVSAASKGGQEAEYSSMLGPTAMSDAGMAGGPGNDDCVSTILYDEEDYDTDEGTNDEQRIYDSMAALGMYVI